MINTNRQRAHWPVAQGTAGGHRRRRAMSLGGRVLTAVHQTARRGWHRDGHDGPRPFPVQARSEAAGNDGGANRGGGGVRCRRGGGYGREVARGRGNTGAAAHGDHGGEGSVLGGGPARRDFAVDLAGAEGEDGAIPALGWLPEAKSGGERRRLQPRSSRARRCGLVSPMATTATSRAPAAVRSSLRQRGKETRGGGERRWQAARGRESPGGKVISVHGVFDDKRAGELAVPAGVGGMGAANSGGEDLSGLGGLAAGGRRGGPRPRRHLAIFLFVAIIQCTQYTKTITVHLHDFSKRCHQF